MGLALGADLSVTVWGKGGGGQGGLLTQRRKERPSLGLEEHPQLGTFSLRKGAGGEVGGGRRACFIQRVLIEHQLYAKLCRAGAKDMVMMMRKTQAAPRLTAP